MALRLLPDLITLLRLAATPFVAWLLLALRFREALALVLLAGLTDWLDGFTARRLAVSGRLGAILDPLADKILLVTLFIILASVRRVPEWLVALVIGRDLVIVLGALLLRAFRGVRRFAPSLLGKVSTFFQIVFVLLVLLRAAYPFTLFVWLETIAFGLTALFTALSGIGYIRLGIQMARRPAAESL